MKIPQSKDSTTSSLIHNLGSARKAWKLSLLPAFFIVPCLPVQGAILASLDVQYVTNDTTYDMNANIPAGHTLLDWKTWKFASESAGTAYSAVTSVSPEMLGGSGQIDRTLTDSGQNWELGAGGITGLSFTWTGGTPAANGPSSGPIPVAVGWAGDEGIVLSINNLQPGLTYEAQFITSAYVVNPTVTLQSGGSSTFVTDNGYLDSIISSHSGIITVQFDTETVGDVLTLSGGMGEWGGGVLGVRLTAVPEPSTYALFVGVFGIGFAVWRRSRRAAI